MTGFFVFAGCLDSLEGSIVSAANSSCVFPASRWRLLGGVAQPVAYRFSKDSSSITTPGVTTLGWIEDSGWVE